jgi:hypothetical protein
MVWEFHASSELKQTRFLKNRTNSAMVSCLNATKRTGDDPLGSKRFALNSTYKVVLKVDMVFSEKKNLPLALKLSNFGWILKLIYLPDMSVKIKHFMAKPSSESHCTNRRC